MRSAGSEQACDCFFCTFNEGIEMKKAALATTTLFAVFATIHVDASPTVPYSAVRVEGQAYERTASLVEEGKPIRAKLTLRHRYKDGNLRVAGKTNMRREFLVDITVIEKATGKVSASGNAVIGKAGEYTSDLLGVPPGEYSITASVKIAQARLNRDSDPRTAIKINSKDAMYYCGPCTYEKREVGELIGGGTGGSRQLVRKAVRTVLVVHPPSGKLVIRDRRKKLVRVEMSKDVQLK